MRQNSLSPRIRFSLKYAQSDLWQYLGFSLIPPQPSENGSRNVCRIIRAREPYCFHPWQWIEGYSRPSACIGRSRTTGRVPILIASCGLGKKARRQLQGHVIGFINVLFQNNIVMINCLLWELVGVRRGARTSNIESYATYVAQSTRCYKSSYRNINTTMLVKMKRKMFYEWYS